MKSCSVLPGSNYVFTRYTKQYNRETVPLTIINGDVHWYIYLTLGLESQLFFLIKGKVIFEMRGRGTGRENRARN